MSSKNVNWGGLTTNILAGAAIVIGVELVFPGLSMNLFEGIKGIATSMVPSAASSEPSFFSTAMGALLTKIAGVAMGIVGVSYLTADKGAAPEPHHHTHEQRESFTARLDMQKTQAVMMARMQAQGHEPAMAMAAQNGRG
jgi:hypothetical protein